MRMAKTPQERRDAARAEQKTSKPRRAKSPGRPSKSTTKSAPYGGGRVLIVRS